MDVKGRAAVITGSATGVGAATARLLASKGCNVVINYTKSEAEAKETEAACRAFQVDAMLCKADVSKDADCRRMADEAAKRWGRLDIVVCSAGRTKLVKSQDMEELSAQDFLDIYSVNTIGTYQAIRAALPHMRKNGEGAVSIVSALGAIDGTGSCMAYSASKGAINVLVTALARQLGPEGIRVNAVAPGFIEGRWMRGLLGDEAYARAKDTVVKTAPLRRVNTPEDVANTLVWLIESDVLTGEILTGFLGQKITARPR
jgi:NAD(P)-dependent dehydrogenase (short-subunit alcohol dehydrogenase family)